MQHKREYAVRIRHIPPCIKYAQYRMRGCSAGLGCAVQAEGFRTKRFSQPVLHIFSLYFGCASACTAYPEPYCTPSACIAHTLCRVRPVVKGFVQCQQSSVQPVLKNNGNFIFNFGTLPTETFINLYKISMPPVSVSRERLLNT